MTPASIDATVADLDRLAPLVAAFFKEEGIDTAPTAQRENLAAMIQDPTAMVRVIEIEGQLAGFMTATTSHGIEFGLSAEIEDLYLKPAFRGQGLARPLMEEAIAWCQKQGAQKILVVVTGEGESKLGLSAFYKHFGFKPDDRITFIRSAPC